MAKRRPARGRAKGTGVGKAMAALLCAAGIILTGVYLFVHTRGRMDAQVGSLSSGEAPHAVGPVSRVPSPDGPPATQTDERGPAAGSQPASPRQRVAPFGISEEVFEGGARAYKQQRCAGCHGRPGKNGSSAGAEQFWSDTHAKESVAVADRSAGEIYQAIASGAPASGMPAYQHQLNDTEIWDLALLLKSSREDLPDPVLRILHGAA